MRSLLLLSTALTMVAPLVARADETLPPLVITATRLPTPADEIAAGVTVIDRATIEQRGYVTLTDALAAVPGAHIVQTGGPGAQASLFVRGTNSNDVLVLRDGVPINEPAEPNNAFDFGGQMLADVERIEVIRGPLSGLYGSGAVGGVVNIISRRGTGDLHGSASGGLGGPFASLGSVSAGGVSGNFDYSATIQGAFDTGFDVTPQRETGVYTGERDGYRSWLGAAQIGYSFNEDTRLSLIARSQRTTSGLDNSGYVQAFDDPNYTGYGENWFGKLGFTTALAGGAWQTGLSASWQQSSRRYTNLLDPADPNQEQVDNQYQATRYDFQWSNTVHLPDAGFAKTNALTFGYEFTRDLASSAINSLDTGLPYNSAVSASENANAGYIGAQTTLAQRLTLNVNARETAYSLAGSAATWRAGAVLALPEVSSRLKSSGGTAFVAPSLFDLYGTDSYGYVGNPDLKPERATGWDVGFETDIAAFGRAQLATVGVTYFDIAIQDLITLSAQYTPVNVGRARSTGVETTLTLNPADWLQATLAYTYTDARDEDTGAALLRRPRNGASANLVITPLPGLSIAPEVVYIGNFQDYLVDNNGFTTYPPGRASSGTLVNLAVTYRLIPHVTLWANGRNLANARYEPASGFAAPGVNFLAGVRVDF